MRNKSLMFIGDSLSRNQADSLLCLLSHVAYPKEAYETDLTKILYETYNFTIFIFMSPLLVRYQQGKDGHRDLYLDEVDQNWSSRINDANYIIISAGIWFTNPSTMLYENGNISGCLYCDSKELPQLSMYSVMQKAFRTVFDTITSNTNFRGVTVMRTLSPEHFEYGVWNKGGDCQRTVPFGRNETELKAAEKEMYEAQVTEFLRAKSKGMDFRLLDMTNAMLRRADGHPRQYGHDKNEHWPYNDCVHWCLPGPVDMWNDMLVQVLS